MRMSFSFPRIKFLEIKMWKSFVVSLTLLGIIASCRCAADEVAVEHEAIVYRKLLEDGRDIVVVREPPAGTQLMGSMLSPDYRAEFPIMYNVRLEIRHPKR